MSKPQLTQSLNYQNYQNAIKVKTPTLSWISSFILFSLHSTFSGKRKNKEKTFLGSKISFSSSAKSKDYDSFFLLQQKQQLNLAKNPNRIHGFVPKQIKTVIFLRFLNNQTQPTPLTGTKFGILSSFMACLYVLNIHELAIVEVLDQVTVVDG